MKRPFLHQHYPGWRFNMLMLILILGGPCIVKGQTDQGKVGDVILNGKSYEVLWDLNGLSGKRQALRAIRKRHHSSTTQPHRKIDPFPSLHRRQYAG